MPREPSPDHCTRVALLQMLNKRPDQTDKPAVALIHADGVIVDGATGESLLGGGGEIGSEDLRRAFRMAVKDENVAWGPIVKSVGFTPEN